MRKLVTALMMVVFAVSTTLAAEDDYTSPRVGYLEAGQYCPTFSVNRRPAPGTSAGYTDLYDGRPALISASRMIELRPDNTFGIYVQLADPNDIAAATTRITHPPFLNEDKTTVELDTSDFVGTDGVGRLFSFDYSYEMVPGVWTFEAMDGDELLYRVSFNVVPASSDAPHACGPAPTS